ncbi:nuclear transport factor 2 family protein [Mycolicibacterium rufum]|uniref:Nuclear transport factor 2 family protein n=1 Tax=Mycolicibacterium rufum TaxID=318424 RepID=A0A9X2YCM1_9MYCO|nr:nuclear transport factor 2 family protein [Mycolicibacterium rufum]MCV7071328.1 nuclear transport factor 2 family protein [Mycolicibacterium rufum]ULP38037.1 nuclear transport factor 2 family protein [Mycolicibacterium rufum]
MSTRELIERWVSLFNAGDAEGIAGLYAEDAVNHQIPLAPVVGRRAIADFHRDTFAGGPLTCTPLNLVVDDDWAALEWTDPDGFRGCGFFQVQDGVIVLQRGYWDGAQLARAHPDVHPG